jgi:hypothetical protein
VVQTMGEPSIELPSVGEPLVEEPLVRDSFAEVLLTLQAEVAHVAWVMVASQQLVSFAAKLAWVLARISSFVLGPASD